MKPRDHGLKESLRVAYHPIASRIATARTNRNKPRTTRPRKSRWWPIPRSTVSKALCYASVGLIPVVLLLWLPLDMPNFKNTNVFGGSPIGGRLTLKQAKAIDFVSSAILAPLILAALNYVWFVNARTSIADERPSRSAGTSVYALVEASTTTSGSFDVFKLWTLCSSRSGRLMALAMLTLLAAFARSFLSNIIAYEAFMQPVDATPVQLRLLAGPTMSSTSDFQANGTHFDSKLNATVDDFWLASHDQRREFVMQTTNVLQQVAWRNSTLSLNSSVYVALNATTAAISALAGSVIGLHDVRAVRATIECRPHSPSSLTYFDLSTLHNSGSPAPHISLTLDNWTADVPAPLSVFQDGGTTSISNSLDFLAYNMSTASMYVGSMALVAPPLIQGNWTKNNTVPLATPFGALQATRRNLTSNANGTCAEGYVCEYLVWGLVCSIHQQQGLLNLARGTADQKWTMGPARWELAKEVRPSILDKLWDSLGKLEFKSLKAGLGPALTLSAEKCATTDDLNDPDCYFPGPKHLNYRTLADNLLFAEMEIQRVAYETAAMNATMATPDMYSTVATTAGVQRYRVTYIPALLIGSLICIFLAAVLTAGLTLVAANTTSSRQFRTVHSLRLLMDCVSNFQDETLRTGAKWWSNDELKDWAKTFIVRYQTYQNAEEHNAQTTVVLTPVAKSEGGE